MKIEGGTPSSQPCGQDRAWRSVAQSGWCLEHRRAEAEPILNWYAETLHEGSGVYAETLLARDQWIAMMGVFHLAPFEILRTPTSWCGAEQQASSFSCQKLLECLDLFRSASCSVTIWSRPKTISVSVSASIRSSIGSF